VPAHTEARIHQLCSEAIVAQTQSDVDRIVTELRAALEEHVRLAKQSLEGQITSITALDALSQRGA
jgi:hypothetical protein